MESSRLYIYIYDVHTYSHTHGPLADDDLFTTTSGVLSQWSGSGRDVREPPQPLWPLITSPTNIDGFHTPLGRKAEINFARSSFRSWQERAPTRRKTLCVPCPLLADGETLLGQLIKKLQFAIQRAGHKQKVYL